MADTLARQLLQPRRGSEGAMMSQEQISQEFENWFVDESRPLAAPEPTVPIDIALAEKCNEKTLAVLRLSGLKYEGLAIAGGKLLPKGLDDSEPAGAGFASRAPVPASLRIRGGRPVSAPALPAAVVGDRTQEMPQLKAISGEVLGDDEITEVGECSDDDATTLHGKSSPPPLPPGASLLDESPGRWPSAPVENVEETLGQTLLPLAQERNPFRRGPDFAAALGRVHKLIRRLPVPVVAAAAGVLLVGMTTLAMAGSSSPPEEPAAIAAPIVPMIPVSTAPAELPASPGPEPSQPGPAAAATDGPTDFDFTETEVQQSQGPAQDQPAVAPAPHVGHSSRAAHLRHLRVLRARRIARLRRLRPMARHWH